MWHLEFNDLSKSYEDLGCGFMNMCRCKHFEDYNGSTEDSSQWVKANVHIPQSSAITRITNLLKLRGGYS